MSKEKMLFLYLNVIATNCQDGVGIIDGYSIADYATFRLNAHPAIVDAVNDEIERRKNQPSVWLRLNQHLAKAKKRKIEKKGHPCFPEYLFDLPLGPRQQVGIQIYNDEQRPGWEFVSVERIPQKETANE